MHQQLLLPTTLRLQQLDQQPKLSESVSVTQLDQGFDASRKNFHLQKITLQGKSPC
jgi:hypothetical protein